MLKSLKCSDYVTACHFEQCGEIDGVLDRHAGTLRERLQGRVRGIAKQRDAASGPLSNGIAIGKRPAPGQIHQSKDCLHLRMRIPIGFLELGLVGYGIVLLGVGIRPEHRDDVELRAIPQRVVDDVKGRTDP
ncbi:hypothetical protein IVA93_21515 [Bradyrhizobium sp. 155]|uniref:hypothetical protein n=1 Tax=Bradyrhizobium sp. 155 TaxID=2782629 RepID=UPI001FFE3AFB|nr:hypothetical protein [Bradyrhizobium sp. 155]UPK15548.1 hypothetical protein IVA93_21515 [Bradyrhizobium sp. 155]